jgi:polyisoprenyl-teichoic acid--peptidoglycan teichoic acid transferase
MVSVKTKQRITMGIVYGLALIGFGLLLYNTLLPWWMDGLIAVGLVGLLALGHSSNAWMAWGSRLGILGIVAALFVTQWVAQQLFDAQNDITLVSVVALADYPADTLEEVYFADALIPRTYDDDVKAGVREHLDAAIPSLSMLETDDEITALAALMAQTVDLVVLDSAALANLEETDPLFRTNTKILGEISLTTKAEVQVKPVNTATTPFIVLINGRDNPTGTSLDLTDTNVNTNNDINLVMVINPLTSTITMLTLPRDSYVALACKDGAMDKLTHAGRYGTQCTIDTIEALLGITVNYSVKLNFPGFMNLIEVIGDITVDNQMAFTTVKNKVHFPQGLITLDPQEALEFVRERKSLPGGDYQRIRNQHEVVKGILRNLISVNSVVAYAEILDVISASVLTNITLKDLSPLIQKQVAQGIQWELNTLSVTGKNQSNPTYTYPSLRLFTYVLDEASVEAASKALIDAQQAR